MRSWICHTNVFQLIKMIKVGLKKVSIIELKIESTQNENT